MLDPGGRQVPDAGNSPQLLHLQQGSAFSCCICNKEALLAKPFQGCCEFLDPGGRQVPGLSSPGTQPSCCICICRFGDFRISDLESRLKTCGFLDHHLAIRFFEEGRSGGTWESCIKEALLGKAVPGRARIEGA